MERFNLDLLKSIAIYLDPEDILHFCAISKWFSLICKDPYFWKQKLLYDFPDVDTENIDQPKIIYLKLYADHLVQEAERIKNSYTSDPLYLHRQKEIPKLVPKLEKDLGKIQIDLENLYRARQRPYTGTDRKASINNQIDILKNKERNISDEINKITFSNDIKEEYEQKAEELNIKAYQLRRAIGSSYSDHYYDVRIDRIDVSALEINYGMGLFADIKLFRSDLSQYIDNLVLENGTLIGVSNVNNREDAFPDFLIYVYQDEEWPHSLHIEGYHINSNRDIAIDLPHMMDMLYDRDITLEDLKDIYGLPFNIAF